MTTAFSIHRSAVYKIQTNVFSKLGLSLCFHSQPASRPFSRSIARQLYFTATASTVCGFRSALTPPQATLKHELAGIAAGHIINTVTS